ELVSTARQGDDEIAIAAQCFSQVRKMNLQVVFLDNALRPDRAHELVLADGTPCGASQHGQYVKGARTDGQLRTVSPQRALVQVDLDLSHFDDALRRLSGHPGKVNCGCAVHDDVRSHSEFG